MNNRLNEIILYKTGGRKAEFASLIGWTPQYLTKLLKGENFGISPVKAILSALPEIDARWLLFGTGNMITPEKICTVRSELHECVKTVLDVERYMPVMTPEELNSFEKAITGLVKPDFSPEQMNEWQERTRERVESVNRRIAEASAKSEKLCRQKTAKK